MNYQNYMNWYIFRDTFDHLVCDQCNDSEKYPLTTKSDALKEYLLTDKLLTRHNLKYKLKKNPHNTGWGEMKLFLVCQIEELALQERPFILPQAWIRKNESILLT